MGARDQGWIQIFCETNQEVYENTLLALRLSENFRVLLPTMVMQDGFVTSHSAERVRIFEDNLIGKFIGEYVPHKPLLNFEKPVTYGSIVLPDNQFEIKRQQIEAMRNVKREYINVGRELSKITSSRYSYFERYKLNDADAVIIVSSSTAGTAKEIVDVFREKGEKVGLLKIKLFRPFPYEELAAALKNVKVIGILDRAPDFGSVPPIHSEVKNSLAALKKQPQIQSYVFGLGGREIEVIDMEKTFSELLAGKIDDKTKYLGFRE
jgi:pyruvate ferredoxin oxidoreductase alpha subunit